MGDPLDSGPTVGRGRVGRRVAVGGGVGVGRAGVSMTAVGTVSTRSNAVDVGSGGGLGVRVTPEGGARERVAVGTPVLSYTTPGLCS